MVNTYNGSFSSLIYIILVSTKMTFNHIKNDVASKLARKQITANFIICITRLPKLSPNYCIPLKSHSYLHTSNKQSSCML